MLAKAKVDVIIQLKRELLALQGFKNSPNCIDLDVGLGSIKHAFPNSTFPLGAIHEFICESTEGVSASAGFVTGLLSTLMNNSGIALWISKSQTIFPPALKSFGVSPDRVIFIHLQNTQDILWTIEEALKCNTLSAVIGEVSRLSFTESRRLQLAVEQSKVTGLILRSNQSVLNTTVCIARWKITHSTSFLDDNMPGVGFPRWNVELLKVRNGKSGSWQLEWMAGRFRTIVSATHSEQQRKAG